MSITTTNKAQIMESVLADGDLSKLTSDQRLAYYFQVCESLGLNPYTRPFDYITLNGKKVLYPKRDCTDQLRRLRNITLTVTDKRIEDDLFIVTVRATDAHSRSDEDFGAVSIGGLKGEARANAMLKAITKAKRRVTLSICGMGMNDETELESIPGAVIESIEIPEPDTRDALNATVPIRPAAAATPRPPRVAEKPSGERTDEQWRVWLDKLRAACGVLYSRAEVVEIGERASVADAIAKGPPWVRQETSAILAEAYAKHPKADDAEASHEPADVA